MATFGKLTSGTSSTAQAANRKFLSQYVLSEDAILESMTTRAGLNNTTQARHWKGVIYSDVAGVPTALLATTAEGTVTAAPVASYTENFAGEALPAGTYWIGVIQDGNATTSFLNYRGNDSGVSRSNLDSYTDGPTATAGSMNAVAGPGDSYVTYTPDVGVGITGQGKVKSGGSFTAHPVKVRSGGTFAAATAKYKGAGTWTTTPY